MPMTPQPEVSLLTTRQQHERLHYDETYSRAVEKNSDGSPRFPPESHAFYCISGAERRPHNQDWEFLHAIKQLSVENRDVLELGCGAGHYTIVLAKLGAQVSALDISEAGVDLTRARARHYGLQRQVLLRVTSVENMDFDDESFDVVVGTYILHHIDIAVAARQIRRVLRPGGTAMFLEWVRWSPFDRIRSSLLLRKIARPYINGEVTEDERKLDDADFAVLRDHFRSVSLRRFYSLSRLRYFYPKSYSLLERTDYWLYQRFPAFRNTGGAAIITLTK